MAAIIGLPDNQVEEICRQVTKGFVVPANYNCPGQVAISGEKNAVHEAMEIAKQNGAKRAIELKTAGPFHTDKLEEASQKLKQELEKVTFNSQWKANVIKNKDGSFYKKEEDIKQILAEHVIKPVRFKEGIQTMLKDDIDAFIEIGPGKVLTGFIKKIEPRVKTFNIYDVPSLLQTIEEIKKERICL